VRTNVCFASLLAVLTVTFMAGAQEGGEAETPTRVPARALERENPEYPESALSQGREGWVTVSFVISTTGDVIEPMIEASSGGAAFEQAALRAVEGWKYAPATQDGVPVEQAMVKTVLRFSLEAGRGPEGPSREFVRNYQRLVQLVDGQDFSSAAALLAEMEADRGLNRFETAWFWWAKYVYLSRTSPTDVAEARRVLERAVGFEEQHLSMPQFVAALERLVVLQAQALDFASAIAAFERLRDTVAGFETRRGEVGLEPSPAYAQSVATLQPSYDAMLKLADGAAPLVMSGSVGEFDYWVHDILRRSFSVADIKGRLDTLDIRCERGTRRYDSVPIDSIWYVPDKWGTCGVYLKGEPGTTFAFREYPNSAVPPAAIDVSQRAAGR
jgi:TonB family protein